MGDWRVLGMPLYMDVYSDVFPENNSLVRLTEAGSQPQGRLDYRIPALE